MLRRARREEKKKTKKEKKTKKQKEGGKGRKGRKEEEGPNDESETKRERERERGREGGRERDKERERETKTERERATKRDCEGKRRTDRHLLLGEFLVLPHPSHNRKQPKLRVLVGVDARLWPVCVFCPFDGGQVRDVRNNCRFFGTLEVVRVIRACE